VLHELPAKHRQLVIIQPDESVVEPLAQRLAQLKNTDSSGVDKLSADKRALLMELFNDSAKAKLEPVIEYVLEVAETGRKFLTFAHHQLLLDGLEEALAKKGARFIRIDGATPAKKREELVERF
jgi:SWI/SNF-related matrix-associated actin-dependent regulator 1 of chromatin subfamily A